MTSGLDAAIAAHFEQQEAARAARQPFEPDPEMERAGRQLDQLRQDNPGQWAGAGLADLRSRVTTYRQRKLAHEEQP